MSDHCQYEDHQHVPQSITQIRRIDFQGIETQTSDDKQTVVAIETERLLGIEQLILVVGVGHDESQDGTQRADDDAESHDVLIAGIRRDDAKQG